MKNRVQVSIAHAHIPVNIEHENRKKANVFPSVNEHEKQPVFWDLSFLICNREVSDCCWVR